jgi:hypothetical protein
MKWIRGFRWEAIKDGILHHRTSQGDKQLKLRLSDSPRVMAALKLVGVQPKGPMVVNDATGLPYHAFQFRRVWRDVATAAGVPKEVKNRDSRGRKAATDDDDSDPEMAATDSVDLSFELAPETRH